MSMKIHVVHMTLPEHSPYLDKDKRSPNEQLESSLP